MKRVIIVLFAVCLMLAGCSKSGKPQETPSQTLPTDDVVAEKPVIYLYGYDNENVSVRLSLKGELTCTYPKYDDKNGWEIVAKKDSSLVDTNKKTYSYLYWEGNLDTEYDFKEGYCIRGKDTADFLEKELKALGLNRKEMNEFIIYWLPRMEKNNYNVISFQTKAYTEAAKLDVVPKPDKTFRVFMAWYPSAEFVEIKEQEFTVPSRGPGKILVEWGGAEVDSQTHKAVASADSATNVSDEEIVAGLASRTPEQIQLLLAQAVYKKQQIALVSPGALPGNPLMATTPVPTAGHPFTDKNGNKTTFTEAEWNKLKSIWAYTGNAEEMISHHTIGELRSLL